MHVPHMSGLDLNLALVVHALLAERSVSRAAKRLGLSQSATSARFKSRPDICGTCMTTHDAIARDAWEQARMLSA